MKKPLEQQLSEIGNKELEKLRKENAELKAKVENTNNLLQKYSTLEERLDIQSKEFEEIKKVKKENEKLEVKLDKKKKKRNDGISKLLDKAENAWIKGGKIKLYNQVLEKDSENIGALNGLAKVYELKRNYKWAIHYLEKSAEASGWDDDKFISFIFDKASSSKNPDLELAYYGKILEKNSKHSSALNNMGWAYEKKGNLANAISYYERASKTKPKVCLYHLNLGKIYMAKQKYKDAVVELETAKRLDSSKFDSQADIDSIKSLAPNIGNGKISLSELTNLGIHCLEEKRIQCYYEDELLHWNYTEDGKTANVHTIRYEGRCSDDIVKPYIYDVRISESGNVVGINRIKKGTHRHIMD